MTDAPRNDPNMLSVPFIFVKRGDPLPVRWMAEHPDYIKVPAVMVPHGTRPPPAWGDAGAGAAAVALKPTSAAESRIPGSFAPPPARRKCLPNGQPWPKDRNGGDWPKDRWGRPTRPLWDYPPGVRAPGEGIAAGAPGGVGAADAIGSARAALAALDPANVRAILAGDRTGGGIDGTQTPPRGAASRYPGAYDVAQAGEGKGDRRSDSSGDVPARAHVVAMPESYVNKTYRNAFGINCVAFAQSVAGAPLTERWEDLGPVNADTPRGTWVGTFLNGHFQGHVGVFDHMNPDGTITIFDQYESRPWIKERDVNTRRGLVNDPSKYRIIGW